VSAQIARLEKRLGVTLLHRTTRKLNLTDAGDTYYQHCVNALEEMRTAQSKLEQSKLIPNGTLRITAPADLCQTLLSPVIKQYTKQYPDVSLELVVSNDFRDLVGDKIDLALRVGKLSDSSLKVRRFITSHLGFWASSDYVTKFGMPTTITDLSKHRLLWLKLLGESIDLYDSDEQSFHCSESGWFTVDDMGTYQNYIEAGMGIGLLPEFVGTISSGKEKTLRRVLPQLKTKPFAVYFVYPRQSFVPPTVRCFIETALQDASRY
jgi:DNA-binding transcriptional LysR family regulator